MASSILKLAQIGTIESRKHLFAQVSELVVSDLEQRTEQELSIFAEVILKLYNTGSLTDRTDLALRLAALENVPHDLACRMAEDDITVAMPLLADCPVFTQEDLLDFTDRFSLTHLQALARRNDLSTEVSDALAARNDRTVNRLLAGNRGIRLSRETMLLFVKLAEEDVVLREDLALRSDLSPTACRALLPLVNEEARKRLHGIIEGSLTQEQLDQIARLKALRRDFGAALANPDINSLWQDAERADMTVDELMILLLQDGRFDHAVELLGVRGRTSPKAFKEAVFNGKLELVMKIAAKTGLETSTFALFARTRCGHLKLPAAQGSEWTQAYKRHLESTATIRQSRCGDFQANRGAKKPKPLQQPSVPQPTE
ncbi:DUF2336 domain-containing protein [Roseibium marinum]|uniref:Uncharacterized protein DUF2336 n=1 Tax=Roseibium marinum TaxID=281252 RepID=A0A2S3UL61_9HYPH|nr:DUF2336 domain-containing protein [Roseibium marinum]POF28468.1 uncharacterized protein DUF2336 [Roseibium marinum]